MADSPNPQYRRQLLARRRKLEDGITEVANNQHLERLLVDVDAALARLEHGSYGLCETCHEPVEPELLTADPLYRFCLSHLPPDQQRALEEDLELARNIQTALLPPRNLHHGGWAISYHYAGAGPVSGDYCDIIPAGDDLFFMIGDVAGKGVSASMLMAHLHATFQTLVSLGWPLIQIFERASSMFCESTLTTHFATLICGRARSSGEVEICNAGHVPAVLSGESGVTTLGATGLPLGMFCEERFEVDTMNLKRGETILLYTDGLSEARNASGDEYGTARLTDFVIKHRLLSPADLVSACAEDWQAFRSGKAPVDDLAIMAVQRTH